MLKYLIIFVCIVGFLAFVLVTVFPQLTIVVPYKLLMGSLIHSSSNITSTKYVVDDAVKPQNGKTYTFQDISLTTDWKETKQLNGTTSLIVQFEDKKFIIINGKEMTVDLYTSLLEKAGEQGKSNDIEQAYKELNIKNNKGMYDLMMNITNNDLSIKTSIESARVYFLLLSMKNIMLRDADKILTYNLNDYTFYQYKPFNDKDAVEIIFFDHNNTQHWVTVGGPDLTQTTIDSLVKTFKVL